MRVITIVEGNVPVPEMKEFEASYASLKQGPFPPGWIMSSLLRNSDNPKIYRIETVWESREALEKYRRSTQTPAAVLLFKKAGVRPRVEIYDMAYHIP